MALVALTEIQTQAIKDIKDWYNSEISEYEYYYLAGYAGTGKTTIVNLVIAELALEAKVAPDPVFCAFTGKAAQILRDKGNTPASTVHSLIYTPDQTKSGEWLLKEGLEENWNLIVLDECSMLSRDIFKDLLSFGKKVLVIGDPGQLPPPQGKSAFKAPNFTLTEVHRQAEDSGIIQLATQVREGCEPDINSPDAILGMEEDFDKYFHKNMQVLCGRNATKFRFNNKIRRKSYPFPEKGERIICLKNSKDYGVFNGQQFIVESHGLEHYDEIKEEDFSLLRSVQMELLSEEGRKFFVRADFRYFWAAYNRDMKMYEKLKEEDSKSYSKPIPFEFAYAITTHKAQGSQWNEVLIIDESYAFKKDANKWLYTAITRAAKKVVVLS